MLAETAESEISEQAFLFVITSVSQVDVFFISVSACLQVNLQHFHGLSRSELFASILLLLHRIFLLLFLVQDVSKSQGLAPNVFQIVLVFIQAFIGKRAVLSPCFPSICLEPFGTGVTRRPLYGRLVLSEHHPFGLSTCSPEMQHFLSCLRLFRSSLSTFSLPLN